MTLSPWKTALSQGALAGSLAALASTAVLAIAGRREVGSAAAPVNAVSHWYWGDEAFQREELDLGHTALGYLTHHGAAIFWASLYAALCRDQPRARTVPGVIGGAAATSAVACFVDYQLTPHRFTPGFEHRLSTPAMVAVYAAFAAGLAAGAYAMRDAYRDEPEPAVQPRPRRRAGTATSGHV